MLTAGMLKYGPTGRVQVTLSGPPEFFSNGTPCLIDGTLCGTVDDPQQYLSGFGYITPGNICVRNMPPNGIMSGGFARTGVGSLALALVEPIAGYIAGLPIVADGRLAVDLVGPPPTSRAFSDGFDQGYS